MNALIGALAVGAGVTFTWWVAYLIGLRTGEVRGEINAKRRLRRPPLGADLHRIES